MSRSRPEQARLEEPSPANTGDGSAASSNAPLNLDDGLAIGGAWVETQLARVRTAVELSMAEARLAASSLQWMLFLAVITAVLALTAWGVLVAGLAVALGNAGLPLWLSLFSIAALHAALALMLFFKILALGENISLPVTRQHLFGTDDEEADQ
jgi:hypothetical protein